MNKRFYQGMKNREDRKKKHDERAKRESADMRKNGESIHFYEWGPDTKPVGSLGIRIFFKEPIAPVSYKREIRSVLERIFDGHL